jgi:hypothetical protein
MRESEEKLFSQWKRVMPGGRDRARSRESLVVYILY